MTGAAPAARAVAAWDRRATLALLVALGLGLRLWSAYASRAHDDEMHYAADAMWSVAPFGWMGALSFLRQHPYPHLRLDPETGHLRPWGRTMSGEIPRLGHPTLLQYVGGIAVAVRQPATPWKAVIILRKINSVADTATIALLPTLASALGASSGAGLLAAALYAVYPPAITYGSLAYLDPPLAPLLVLLLIWLLAAIRTGTGWLRVGVVTGFLVATKQVGLIALVVVPLAVGIARPRGAPGLLPWALATVAVVVSLTDPLAYVQQLLHPSRPIGHLHLAPLSTLAQNVALLAQPSSYYWLSFARHGTPLAPTVARLHPVLTPAIEVAWLAGLVAAAIRRDRLRLFVLAVPAMFVLGWIMPSDGLWRFHLLSPLVCLGAALALTVPSEAGRTAALTVAALAGATAILPARPDADGRLDLADLLRMNPRIAQPQAFHDAANPLVVMLEPWSRLSRQVWLRPGRYAVEVAASGTAVVALDGHVVLDGEARRTETAVEGWVHRLSVEMPRGGGLEALGFRQLDR